MATDDATSSIEGPIGPSEDDRPELLIKLQERKVRHKQRNVLHRAATVALGVLIVCAGIVLTLPGVPGPGIVTIIFGVGFLALEFDWAERLLERVIIWGDHAAERAGQATMRQRVVTGIVTVLVVGAFVIAAVLWDIPLVPVL
jgi:uncharacterized protein (TIGR02611 family)